MMGLVAELEEAVSKLELPQRVSIAAALICGKGMRKDLLRKKSAEAILSASLYAACRMLREPRTLHEISTAFHEVNENEIGKVYRILCKELGFRIK